MSNSNGHSPDGKPFSSKDDEKTGEDSPQNDLEMPGIGWFKLYRVFVQSKLMTITEAVLFSALIHCARNRNRKGSLDQKGWFVCPEKYLTWVCGWEPTSQKRLLGLLQEKGYLRCKTRPGGWRGWRLRYVKLKLKKLRSDIEAWQDKSGCSGKYVPEHRGKNLPEHDQSSRKCSGKNLPEHRGKNLPEHRGKNLPEHRGKNLPEQYIREVLEESIQETTPSRPSPTRGSAARGESVIASGFLQDANRDNAASSFARHCTIQLYSFLKPKNLVDGRMKKETWDKDFAALQRDYPESEIREVLDWYVKNFDEQYTPECLCARSFRTKYIKVKRAMERQARPAKPQLRPNECEPI